MDFYIGEFTQSDRLPLRRYRIRARHTPTGNATLLGRVAALSVLQRSAIGGESSPAEISLPKERRRRPGGNEAGTGVQKRENGNQIVN